MAPRIAGFALLLGSALHAADWPQWRGPARDGQLVQLAPRASWPETLSAVWKARVGIGHASPLVAEDRVFVFTREGEEEVVQGFELASGRRVWRAAYPAPYALNPAATRHGKGPKSTPVLDHGRLYTFGISGILSCFDVATGRLVWRKDPAGQFKATAPLYGVAMSPVIERGLLIAHLGGPGEGALTAFDAATGSQKWAWKGDGPAYASPIVAEIAGVRQVVTFSESSLIGVSVDSGALLWQLPFTTEYVQNAVTPIVSGDTVIYSGLEHPLRAIQVLRNAGAFATQVLWENSEVAAYMSTPVLVGGRLFGLSHRKKGQFFCLEAKTGRTVWLSPGRQGDNAAVLGGGGMVFFLTSEGELLLAPQAAREFAPARRYAVAESATWAHPVVLEQGVLVKDEESLAFLRF